MLDLIGIACSLGLAAPTLTLSQPRIGRPLFATYSPIPAVQFGSADGLLMFGTRRAAPLPLPGGCLLHVDPVAYVRHWFPLRGAHVIVVLADVPADPSLIGQAWTVQSLLVGPGGVALTNGVEVEVHP